MQCQVFPCYRYFGGRLTVDKVEERKNKEKKQQEAQIWCVLSSWDLMLLQ